MILNTEVKMKRNKEAGSGEIVERMLTMLDDIRINKVTKRIKGICISEISDLTSGLRSYHFHYLHAYYFCHFCYYCDMIHFPQ